MYLSVVPRIVVVVSGSKVDSMGKLLKTVAIWQGELNLGWREEEIADVASYLNLRYYGFSITDSK